MAWRTLPPTIIISGNQFSYLWLTELLASGAYSYYGGGDGTAGAVVNVNYNNNTGSAVTNIFTGYQSGSGGWGNTRAWMRLRCVDGTELLVQNGSAAAVYANVRILGSLSAHFTGTGNGAVSATVIPTATDSWVQLGAGTDNAPTYWFMSITEPRTGPLIGRCETVSPYRWWYAGLGPAGGSLSTLFFRDVCSGNAGDTDPSVYSYFFAPGSYQLPGTVASLAYTLGTDSAKMTGKMGASYTDVQLHVPCALDSTGTPQFVSLGSNCLDRKLPGISMYYGRWSTLTAPNGAKGMSTLWRMKPSITAASGVSLAVASAADSIVVGDLIGEWDGTSVAS